MNTRTAGRIRTIPLLLAASLLLGLAACGQEEEPAARTVYTPQAVDFTTGMQTIRSCCLSGGTIYLSGLPDNSTSSPSQLLRLPLTGGEAQPLPDYQPALLEGEGVPMYYFSSLQAGTDGTIWVTEQPANVEYGQKLPGRTIPDNGSKGGRFERAFILRQLDGGGKELKCFSAREPELEAQVDLGPVYGLLGDGDGQVWVQCERGLAALTDSGETDFTLPVKEYTAVLLSDGRVAASSFFQDAAGDVSICLQIADKEKRDWGETITLPSNAWAVYGGSGDALFYYKTSDTVCAWNQELGEGEQLLNTIDLGMDEDYFSLLSRLEDGRVVLMSGSGVMDASRLSLTILTPTEGGKDRKVLTLATLQLTGDLRGPIVRFNQTSPDYRIAVTDYSQYGGREAAMTRLATEIGAGKMPDLLDLYAIPTARWAANGMLEDLWPWIDRDPELSREDLMERVFQAMEINGKLYEVSDTFMMGTVFGRKDIVGDRMTWTPEDMEAALAELPEGSIGIDEGGADLLLNILRLDWGQFVDWEKGECSFDSEGFKDLLAFCGRYAGSVSGDRWERVNAGQQLAATIFPNSFEAVQVANAVAKGDAAFVGYPNPWGKVGSSFRIPRTISMCSACKHKEGAWAFMRTLLLPREQAPSGYQQDNYFYTNKENFQRSVQKAMSSAISYTMVYGDISVQYHKVTQEEYDQLMALYNAMDTVYRRDLSLEAIISEVAGAYFAGDKSLDEAASLIQNRASLYVNEQK